ncbi:UDP-N-acetylglucosamine 2-epimerase [Anaerovibrio lipolyticus]|uniref:UDP-N-acetylglucosamine 2-epimerase n=1 Tax=Anaerovibrio lipolyticus TaxID=82374 RepID=UPI0026EA1991|nr:UDP-N-acetylglucosamine 2-epimerase [Anaerovibrio lipolyticus]MBE6106903.1 UDP-N-acetylglucosamine 2-epimerase (hydrolyzing) [Anaerovibrio lipolyticus]
MYKVCVVTGTRADYGLLRQLLKKLQKNVNIALQLVVTGSHLSEKFGNTQTEIKADGFLEYIKLPIPIEDDSKHGMAIATGVAMQKMSDIFVQLRPELLVVLGDRFEILAASTAAHMLGIPVAHISGGDVTEGAVDDAIRHCITKMSSLHFPGCEQSRRRIIQMGEHPDTVFNVGEPGVENCLKLDLMEREELGRNLNFEYINGNYSMVTFHPVTMENNTAQQQLYELINAMNQFSDMGYIVTLANADAGGRLINDIWLQEGKKHNNWLVVSSLGVVRYLSTVKYAKLVIGNSSSGVVEAPSMKTPTVNIGDRQKGRMMAESVICCEPKCEDIVNAMRKALTDEFQENTRHIKSPFGGGKTSNLIVNHILDFLGESRDTQKKSFYDIDFSVGDR